MSKFQFTHPGKGATRIQLSASPRLMGFNSRTLGRVRPCSRIYAQCPQRFQFTHPGKGATSTASGSVIFSGNVSIHAPWEGCDVGGWCFGRFHSCFNSRTLGRVRRCSSPPRGLASGSFNSRTLGRVRQCGAKVRIIGRINKRNLRLGVLS